MSEKQEERAQNVEPQTPQKPEDKVIGSGSTWGAKELEQFKVEYKRKNVDPKNFIHHSEKWFDFTQLDSFDKYEKCMTVCYYSYQ